MDTIKGEKQGKKEDENRLQQMAKTKTKHSAASIRHLPPFETRKYSMPTFQSPTGSMPRIPHEQTRYKNPDIHKPFTLPSIQQSYQRLQQNNSRLSESTIISTEFASNKQALPVLPTNSPNIDSCGVNLPSLCNKSIKRPISKSNSSESSSDRSFSDTYNRSTGMAILPVEVTVSSRVEVKKRVPDNLSTPSLKNG
jgi:hypothetical protein